MLGYIIDVAVILIAVAGITILIYKKVKETKNGTCSGCKGDGCSDCKVNNCSNCKASGCSCYEKDKEGNQ